MSYMTEQITASDTTSPAQPAAALEIATFAAGCFWGVEDTFRRVPGVTSTRVGYTGGSTEHPSYRQVCAHTTGHAEAVEVTYDSTQVSYQQLVGTFFELHDPTQMNRQGPDVGDQYRSAIYVHDARQREIAEQTRGRLEAERRFRRPIVTEITSAPVFWMAEDYHQQYFEKRGGGACHI